MENKKAIESLNSLIQINNDRIAGYEAAAKETEDANLKILFGDLQASSEEFNGDLIDLVLVFGGTPVKGTMTSGKFFRAWMDIKAALTGRNSKEILNSCEFGEDMAVKAYKDVLSNEDNALSDVALNVVQEQYSLLMEDHNTVRNLRNSLKEA